MKDLKHLIYFEKLLEEIFWNCDPSKPNEANKPNVDFVYKMNPYYSDFVGDDEENYSNQYYKEYTDYIIAHGYDILPTDDFENIITRLINKNKREFYLNKQIKANDLNLDILKYNNKMK